MSDLAVNGVDGVTAEIHMPRVGVWHADVWLDTDNAAAFGVGAKATITSGNYSWVGTVRRGGLSRGSVFARIVGGAGGLTTLLPAKAYRGVPFSIPLNDILAGAKETLARSSDTATLNTVLQKYTRVYGMASEALASLIQAAPKAVSWRILRNGTLWVGEESWPAQNIDYQFLHAMPTIDMVRLDYQPALTPGDSLQGNKISYVEHRISGEQMRTRLWFEG